MALKATHVPLLKVQGWTWNTLALIDLGTDCTPIQDKLSRFFFCLINSWLSKWEIKQNKSRRRKLVDAFGSLSNKRKKKLLGEGIRPGLSVLVVINVPFLSGAAFNYKPSPLLVCGSWHHLFPIVSIKAVSAVRINEQENMQGTLSPLASMNTAFDPPPKEQYWLLFCCNLGPKIPMDFITLWPQENNKR